MAAAGVLAQICCPLLSGASLRVATVLSVLLLAGAALVHAGAVCRWSAAGRLLLVAGGLGLAVEVVGVRTGVPFGHYSYADRLGPAVAGVPLVVPLAWTMLAYPALLLGRRLATRTTFRTTPRTTGWTSRRWTTALTGGVALAGWDLFLDPQMVAQGNWSWADPTPALPGVPGIPLTNDVGWIVVAVLMIAALDRVFPRFGAGNAPDREKIHAEAELVPAAVLAWTWLGSAVGNLVFFDRPWVALYGGVAMGVVTVPYLLSLSRSTTSASEEKA
jgi:putative membrane protein